MPTISLIATVLNEGCTIQKLLDSLAVQTLRPDEIVLVDGGSTDNTCEIIQQHALGVKLLVEPGSNISQGRNRAIAAATGDIIISTDAGVRLPPEWLEKLTAPFRTNAHTQIVAGFFLPDPDPQNAFEVAMSATVLPLVEEVVPATFLPSSRSVAFTKTAWEQVGGYPEWLDYCEDLIFDLRLQARYGSFTFAPDAVVYFKPRTHLTAFYKQYYLYARGDGKANLWLKRHLIRYLTYLLIIPLVAGWMRKTPLAGLLYLIGGAVYMRQPYRRLPYLWQQLDTKGKIAACAWIPVIRVVGDVAKMLGYPIGWLWRWEEEPPDWRLP